MKFALFPEAGTRRPGAASLRGTVTTRARRSKDGLVGDDGERNGSDHGDLESKRNDGTSAASYLWAILVVPIGEPALRSTRYEIFDQ